MIANPGSDRRQDLPPPPKLTPWMDIFKSMKINESMILYSRSQVNSARICARRKGMNIQVQQVKGKRGEWRIWRVQ